MEYFFEGLHEFLQIFWMPLLVGAILITYGAISKRVGMLGWMVALAILLLVAWLPACVMLALIRYG